MRRRKQKMAGCAPCCSGSASALIPKSMHCKTSFLSPIRIAVIVGGNPSSGNNGISRLRVRVSLVDSSSSSGFARRMERAWLISQVPNSKHNSQFSYAKHTHHTYLYEALGFSILRNLIIIPFIFISLAHGWWYYFRP